MSQMSQITDVKLHGLYHKRVLRQELLEAKKREEVNKSASMYYNSRYVSSQGETELPDYVTKV